MNLTVSTKPKGSFPLIPVVTPFTLGDTSIHCCQFTDAFSSLIMNRYLRLAWCLASIIYLGRASAEDSRICLCRPRAECSRLSSSESPCPDHGQVHCCSAPATQAAGDSEESQGAILDKHQPEQGTDDVEKNAGSTGLILEENNDRRQEKSFGNSEKNGLTNDDKLNEKKKHDKIFDKVFFVYAENNTKQEEVQEKEKRLQIVLPMKEQIVETFKEDDKGKISTETYIIEQSVKESTEKPSIHIHKLLGGNSKLHRLFPKRRVPPSISRSEESVQNKEKENEDGDLEQSASEVDEISVQTVKPPFHAPPRHLARQQIRNESSRQKNKGVHELFRMRSKNVTAMPETQQIKHDPTEKENVSAAEIPRGVVAQNINLKVINNLMKTNYSGRHTTRMLGSNSSPSNSLKIQPSTYVPTIEHQEHSTPLTEARSEINMSKRLHTKRPLALRTRPQPVSTAPTTNRELTPDSTGPGPSVKDSVRKSLVSRTSVVTPQAQEIQVTTESTTQGSGDGPDAKTGQTERRLTSKTTSSVFGARTSRFRQRPSHARSSVATGTGDGGIDKEERVPVALPDSELKSPEVHYLEQEASHSAAGKAGQEASVKEQDLEISATSDHQSRVPAPDAFRPPTEMATGFQPIINIQDLKTVGPLPGGFIQQARSFNEDSDGFGLSPPPASEEFDYNSMLLPPVFLPAGHATTTEPATTPLLSSADGIDPADLLPPVQLPMPLMSEMSREREALTKIQQEFDILKGQYDLLLSRYADTLRQYNDEYEKIIESSKTSTEDVGV